MWFGIRFRVCLTLVAVVIGSSATPRGLHAYTTDSPEVVALIQKAVKVLEAEDHQDPGGKALIAMALLKAGLDRNHPKIQAGATAASEFARTVPAKGLGPHCYNATVCCIFLIELDHERYRSEIQDLLDGIAARQRANGSWGYIPPTWDDTSQSQYGVLAMWAAHVHGFTIEAERIVNSLNWFLRTQDPSGAWSYNPTDPKGGPRIPQPTPTQSMSAAGAGSIYICAYLLGYGARAKAETSATGKSLPAALRSVADSKKQSEFLSSSGADFEAFRTVSARGNTWLTQHPQFAPDQWTHYYMYALERYKAFQAIVEGRPEKEPKWYNDGVDYLRTSEEATGGWLSKHYESPKSVSTAFALLFLTRSTEKSFKKLEGRLRGGQGLPADLTQVNVDAEGRVIDSKEVPPLDVLLGQLDKEGVTELDTTLPIRLQLPADPQQRNAQLVRLRRMATRGPYEVRRMAVNTLARDRNLDNVPALIFALSDPDFRIVRAAQDGLRFISRKIDGNPLPEHPTKAEWQAAQAKWREWYLSLRPEGVGID